MKLICLITTIIERGKARYCITTHICIACENSRPSSLPAEWRFARRNATRPGAKKDGCFRRLIFAVLGVVRGADTKAKL